MLDAHFDFSLLACQTRAAEKCSFPNRDIRHFLLSPDAAIRPQRNNFEMVILHLRTNTWGLGMSLYELWLGSRQLPRKNSEAEI